MIVVLSSTNRGKAAEFQQLLQGVNLQIKSLDEFKTLPPYDETASTFIENALGKARHAATLLNQPTLADDSGLCVTALNGAPGIFSARYAGNNQAADNRKKLLDNLKHRPFEQRQAYFYCTLVFMRHANDPAPLIADASWPGYIALEEKGEGGFGYDSIFFLPEFQATAAELPTAIKNQISHRGKAMQKLLRLLQENNLI
jgi:XTP/dITP diphosphohydrolase